MQEEIIEDWENFDSFQETDLVRNRECAVNTQGFFHKAIKIKTYRCRCPNDKEMIICHSCAINCHNGHKYFVDDSVGQNFICECAKISHKTEGNNESVDPKKKQSISKKSTINMHSNCPFMEISNRSKMMKTYNKEGNTICPFCMIICIKKEQCHECKSECKSKEHFLDPFEQSENVIDRCLCYQTTNEERHLSVQNIDNLIKFFENPSNSLVCDPFKLAYMFMTDDICFKYWESVFTINEGLSESIRNKELLKQKGEFFQYVKSCRLLNTINRYIIKKNYIEINHTEFTLNFQFNFLLDLFSASEIRNSFFIKYKYFNLKIFRKCFILPKMNYLFYDIFQVDYNTNAIHRTLFKPNIEVFFKEIGIEASSFYDLLENILESINRYYTKVSEEEINILLKEYIRFLRLIFNFHVERSIRFKIVKELYKTLEMISGKKDSFYLMSQLEPLIYYLQLENSDERIIKGALGIKCDAKFSFETELYNELLVKIMFICALEKFDENDTEIEKKSVKKTALFDNLISCDDYYLQNISAFSISGNKLLTIEKFTNILNEEYSSFITQNMIDFILRSKSELSKVRELYLKESDLKKFYDESSRIFNDCVDTIKQSFYMNQEKILFQQIVIYKLGLYHAVIKYWSMIKTIHHLYNDLKKEKYYDKLVMLITKLISVICSENPFLIALNFNKNVLNLYFDTGSKKENNINILNLFVGYMKTMIKSNYKLELSALVERIIPCDSTINRWEISIERTFKEFKLFGYCLRLSSEKTKDMMTDRICSHIRNFIISRPLAKFLMEVRKNEVSRESESDDKHTNNLGSKDSLLLDKIEILAKICKILNMVEPQYFFFLTRDFKVSKKVRMSHAVRSYKRSNSITSTDTIMFSIKDLISLYIFKGNKFPPKFLQHLLLTYYKMNFENYTKLEKDDYKELDFLQKVYNVGRKIKSRSSMEIKDKSNILDTSITKEEKRDNERALGIVKKYLMNFPKKVKKHEMFMNRPRFLLDYFSNVILFPTVNLIFKYIMKENINCATVKFEIYNIIVLFLNCFKLLLEILKGMTDSYGNEMQEHIESFFRIEDVDMRTFIKNRINLVNSKLNQIRDPEFPFFKLKVLLNAYSETILNILYIDNIKGISCEEKVVTGQISDFYSSLNQQVIIYKELKSNFETKNMLLFKIFDSDLKSIKNSLCISLIAKLEEAEKLSLTPYTEKNLIIIEMICKIFKADPKQFQDFFTTFPFYNRLLKNIVQNQLLYLTQPIIIEFNRLNTNYSNSTYKYFIYLIEFLRLMCENHNACYQTLLFNTIIFEKTISNSKDKTEKEEDHYLRKKKEKLTIVDFVCFYFINAVNDSILNLKKKKKDLVSIFKPETNTYFNEIVKYFMDFLIEIIQGTFPFNFSNFNVLNSNFYEFFKAMTSNFSLISAGEEIEFILSHFMRFLVAYMEENENPEENKIEIIKKILPKQMYDCFLYSVKKLYVKVFDEGNLNTAYAKYKIPKGASTQFEVYYKSNDEMMNEPLFILSTNIFYFLKLACSIDNQANENFKKIFFELEECSLKVNDSKQSEIISNGEIFLFYNKIIRNIEVAYKPDLIDKDELKEYKTLFKKAYLLKKYEDIRKIISEDEEKPEEGKVKIHNIIFLVHPISLYITELDVKKFKQNAPYQGFNTKLPYILEKLPIYMDNVNLRKELFIKSKLLFCLFEIDYSYCINSSLIISLIVNLLLGLTLRLNPLPQGIIMIDFIVYVLTILHLFMIFIFLTNYLVFEIYKLREYTYVRKGVEKFTWAMMNDYWKLLTHDDCFPLLWNFIFGFIAVLSEDNRWMYSLQLFSVFAIFPTMAIVIGAVRIRYKQFLSTALLIVIIILFYSSISFYMFRDLYFSLDLEENVCHSYLSCFLNMLNYGIRSGSIGDFSSIKAHDDPFYWSYFIFGWIFFFTVMLIMVNVVNGIIVDTFQQLREEHNKKVDDNLNICYSCNLNRSIFEISGKKFELHTLNDHSLTNYLHFLLKIHLIDEQDLNSLDFYVLNAVRENRFDFFPIERTLALEKN